ncbi:tetraacyldisaccharide 4'-kinase [Niveispirillum fermenti]|uniref:tetraacyldisaccharide 4'-kinase n=1 Tax=Niveispirillum fermenti TaxID=1233113 RepID=UPI003A842902
MRTPSFWYEPPGAAATLLAPLALLWRAGAAWRAWRTKPRTASVPVLCVGNLVAGGSGKTPVVIDLVTRLRARGLAAASLSRGHGGRLPGPVAVDPGRHGAGDVGDEPLLLAARNPAWIGRDRVAAARAMAGTGLQVVVMDDGFQNPGLRKDLSLIVVDGASGFGNGRLIPAGPLREPVAAGMARADALVVIGEGPGLDAARAAGGECAVLTARLRPDPAVAIALAGRRVLGFAGIGRPGKFFATLRGIGAQVVEEHSFPDHHVYDAAALEMLSRRAHERDAILVTTEKDAMRLPPGLRTGITALPVALDWDDPDAVERLLDRLETGAGDGQA